MKYASRKFIIALLAMAIVVAAGAGYLPGLPESTLTLLGTSAVGYFAANLLGKAAEPVITDEAVSG